MTTRVVAITGISGGIGSATAAAFRMAGWAVAGVDVRPMEGSVEVDRFAEIDLATEDVQPRLRAFLEDLDRLDALVNSAALQATRTALETSVEEWDRVQAANVRGAFLASKAAHELLGEHGGAVVNVASVHALATSVGAAAYAASKGALTALTRTLAVEWAPRVRVNAVLPGAVDTQMLRSGFQRSTLQPEDARAQVESRTPLGRIGRPDEIAQAILFLADADRSSFVTGQFLVVDGGALARLSTE